MRLIRISKKVGEKMAATTTRANSTKARGSSKTARMFRDAIEKANGWSPDSDKYRRPSFLVKKVSEYRASNQLHADLWFGTLNTWTTEDLADLVAKVRQNVSNILKDNIQLHVQVEVDEAYDRGGPEATRTGRHYHSQGTLDVNKALRSVPIRIERGAPWVSDKDVIDGFNAIHGFNEFAFRDLPYRIVGAHFHYDPTHKVEDNERRHTDNGAYAKALKAGVVYNAQKASFAQPFTNDQRAKWDATIEQVRTAIKVRDDAIRLVGEYAKDLRTIQAMATKRLATLDHYMGSAEDMDGNVNGDSNELWRKTKLGRLEYSFGSETQRGLTNMPMPSIDSGPGDNLTPVAGHADMRLHALKAQLLGMWNTQQANMTSSVVDGELQHSTPYGNHQVPVTIEGLADFAFRPIL
jgi:hypothetical protein